jgi:UDPglucose 6-dehydrogenase
MSAGMTYGEIVFVAVGVPSIPANESNTCCLEAIARCIGIHLTDDYNVIVMRSTMPVGTGDQV